MNDNPLPRHSGAAGLERTAFASRLVGVWTLEDYTEEQPDGRETHPFGPEPQGFLIYTADGFVSAQPAANGVVVTNCLGWKRIAPGNTTPDWLEFIEAHRLK